MLDFRREASGENGLYSQFADGLWKTTFAAFPTVPESLKTEKKVKEFILKNNVEFKQVHEISHMSGLIVFELLNILSRGTVIKNADIAGNILFRRGVRTRCSATKSQVAKQNRAVLSVR